MGIKTFVKVIIALGVLALVLGGIGGGIYYWKFWLPKHKKIGAENMETMPLYSFFNGSWGTDDKGNISPLTTKYCGDSEYYLKNIGPRNWCVIQREFLRSECNRIKECGGYGYPKNKKWKKAGVLFTIDAGPQNKSDWDCFFKIIF